MEFKDTRAIYLQIADRLMTEVLAGRFAPGDRVPSVRELSGELKVNPATVLRAYERLEALGAVEVQRGIGYVVSDGAVEKVREEMRREFFREELPAFRAKMEALGIEWNELIDYKP